MKVQVSNSGKGKRKKLNKEVARNVTKKFEGEKKIGNWEEKIGINGKKHMSIRANFLSCWK